MVRHEESVRLPGGVIPAHPLALDADGRLDERRQRALTRYYLDAGASGVAVAVHTTQFALHEPAHGLLRTVLECAWEEARTGPSARDSALLVAGVVGDVRQAVGEAEVAASIGYDAVLLTPQADADQEALIERACAVGEVLPVIGFYLQPGVGGRELPFGFWQRLVEMDAVAGIKVAPFDRYRTLDVLRAVACSDRADRITLYTGNDDSILADLVAEYAPGTGGTPVRFHGGLLGQCAVWTQRAVELAEMAVRARDTEPSALREVLRLGSCLTDANGAIFDAANGYAGCVAGIHEVLRRQGLLAGLWSLDGRERLSPGQLAEIDRVWTSYPGLRDDEFVAANLDRWLA